MTWILALLPDEAMVLVIAVIGMALMCGFVSRQRAFKLIGIVVLTLLLSPVIGMVVEQLPTWLLLVLGFLLIGSMLRAVSNFVIGSHSTNEMVGILAADCVRFGFRSLFFVLCLPFRLFFHLLRLGR